MVCDIIIFTAIYYTIFKYQNIFIDLQHNGLPI